MRCLHICNDFLGSKVYSQLYSQLDVIGIEQHVFHPLREHNDDDLAPNNFDKSGSKIYYSKTLKGFHRFLFRRKIKYLFNDLVKQVNVSSMDVLHATTLFSDGAIALKIYRQYRIPYIVTVRTTDLEVYLKYRIDLFHLGVSILQNASKIIFITTSLERKFYDHYYFKRFGEKFAHKSMVINNGVNQFWLDDIGRKQDLRPTRILYVGTFLNRKNVINLIKVVLKLTQSVPNLKLAIVGKGGEDEEKVKQLAAENRPCIDFVGVVGNKEALRKLYRSNHIFAMPSHTETFGLVYLEALTQGLPVLYSQNDGIDGTFEHRVGEAVDPNSESDISRGLNKIIHDYSSYDIGQIDFSEFSWKTIAKTYANLYRSILEN